MNGEKKYGLHAEDDVPADVEGLREGPGGDEGSLHLHRQLLGNISERFQLLHVRVYTHQIPNCSRYSSLND